MEQINSNTSITEETMDFFRRASERGLEQRQGQTEMALEICSAIESRKAIAVEAEVGIGKSYAYLIPAVMQYRKEHKQIVITTSTIALQEQLALDAKNVVRMTGIGVPITIAKGMRNYLCEKRLKTACASAKKEDKAVFRRILAYADKGVQQRSDMDMAVSDELWSKVCITKFGKKCDKCSHSCKYRNLRDTLSRTSGIVICNQNLLVAHLMNKRETGKGIFNDSCAMTIVDEAHNLEPKFREQFTDSRSRNDLLWRINDAVKSAVNNRRSDIVLNEEEAKTVRLIFEHAASGRSGGEILPLIVTDDDDYFSCDTLKAVNKIHGILRKEYYCGSEDYPAITDRECFEQARKCIAERDRWQSQNRSRIPVYMACCGICGEPLYRCRNPKDRRWKCRTPGCRNNNIGIAEDKLYFETASILRNVQDSPELLYIEKAPIEYKPDVTVLKGENEVSMRCHIKSLDCERVKREIIELAALKYSKCTYSRTPAITREIKNILAQSTPVTEADNLLIQKAVRKILVGGSGDTEIEFKNGKRITYGGNRK